MRNLALSLFLLCLALVPCTTEAGVWGERGVTRRLAVAGNVVYAADGRGVSVFDVANPAAIRRIDLESGDIETLDLTLFGPAELVVATTAGLDRYAILEDATLRRVGAVAVPGVTRVAASSRFVAAAAGTSVHIYERRDTGLVAVNVLDFKDPARAVLFIGDVLYAAIENTAVLAIDPASGEELGSARVNAVGLALDGDTLWAAAGDLKGLFAIDVEDPRNPVRRGSIGAGTLRLIDVTAANGRVYALESPDRINVLDGSDPDEPRLITTVRDWVHTAVATGTRLFLAGSILDAEKRTYETGIPLRVYEATTLALLGEVRDLAGPISGVWTDGSLAFVVDPPYFRVLDVSQTEAPRELASLFVEDAQNFVRVRNGLAILYGRAKVHLIDVSSPYRPAHLGIWHTSGHPPSVAALARDTLVEANEHSGLHVVDYTDPAHPVQIAGRIFHYHDVAAGDDAVYVLMRGTMVTIDLRDRHKVVDARIDSHASNQPQLDTAPPNVGAPHTLVMRGLNWITIMSLSENRFDPRVVAEIPFERAGLMGTSDRSVYIARDGRLHHLDLTQPAPPVETAMVVTSPMQISVAGEKVVIADRYRLRVYGPDTPPPPPLPPTRRRATRH